ncbi:MAG: AtpZ/AtpI family protein [Anaerolineae bacterium]
MGNQDSEDNNTWSSLWREAMMAMSLGWDLAIPIFGGVLLGYALDRWLHTRYVFTMGLLFLGIGISYYNLARFIRRIDRENSSDEKEG